MIRKLLAAVLLTGLFCAAFPTEAPAALNPTIQIISNTIYGNPGSPTSRTIIGTITLGASDTYVTGGFAITPSQFGFPNAIALLEITGPSTPIASAGQYQAISTLTPSTGGTTITLQQPTQGTSNVTATQTTKSVSGLAGLSANTIILCQLDDAATGGGGTGTWAVTNAVSSCKETSATAFTLTSIAAAPTSGGNFTYFIPGVFAEIASATAVNSVVIPFQAWGS